MVRRIIQLVIGAALAGGGGYLTWLNRAQAPQLFPPNPHDPPWVLVAGLGALVVGLVALVGGALPERGRKLRMAEDAARREAALQTADAYYAERARAADRDWRSGSLPPEPATRTTTPSPPDPQTPDPEPPEWSERPEPPPPAPPEPPAPVAAEPPAPVAPPRHEPSPERVMAPAATRGFPSAATLAPIPCKSANPFRRLQRSPRRPRQPRPPRPPNLPRANLRRRRRRSLPRRHPHNPTRLPKAPSASFARQFQPMSWRKPTGS